MGSHYLDLTKHQLSCLPSLEEEPSLERLYAAARLAYLTADIASLQSVAAQIMLHPGEFAVFLAAAVRARQAIRTSEALTLSDDERALLQKTATMADGPWAGEAAILLGMLAEEQADEQGAWKAYRHAERQFAIYNCPRRAAVAALNATAALSRINPKRRLLNEYQRVYRLAVAANDHGTAGTALQNLSREYQLLGALRVALDYANRAVRAIETDAFGTYQFYTALAHRAHVFAELGYRQKALRDFEEVAVAPFPDLQPSIDALKAILAQADMTAGRPKEGLDRQRLLPTWKERLANRQPGANLSPLENKLIELLAARPHAKPELLTALYGEGGDFFSKENRLKQLLHRLRRKQPGVVDLSNGAYQLFDL